MSTHLTPQMGAIATFKRTPELDTIYKSLVQSFLDVGPPSLEGLVTLDQSGGSPHGSSSLGIFNDSLVSIHSLHEAEILEKEQQSLFIRRVRRGLRAIKDLSHPNVINVHGWISHLEGETIRVSLISAKCEGGEITRYLGEHSEADRRNMVVDISRGLAYLHSNRVVHARLNPKNVLVGTHKGKIVAKISGFQRSYTPEDEWVDPDDIEISMPIQFTPPEIASGDKEAICDTSGDVWCLGCTSMMILRTKKPYDDLKSELHIPSAAHKQIPPYTLLDLDDFEKAFQSCFEYDATKRPIVDDIVERLESSLCTLASLPVQSKLKHELLQADERDLTNEVEIIVECRGTTDKGIYKKKSVCIEILGTFGTSEPVSTSRSIQRHLRICSHLKHPNITDFRGWVLIGEDPNSVQVGLVSIRCNERNVREHLSRHPGADRHRLVRELMWGVEYLHSKGIIHGNIQPENILISNSDAVQLCGFDNAYELHGPFPRLGNERGVISIYSAPEFSNDEGMNPNQNTDIWSFGCTSMEILSGHRPYDWLGTMTSDMENIPAKPPYDMSAVQDDFSRIVIKCLSINPDGRPRIDDVIASLPVSPVDFRDCDSVPDTLTGASSDALSGTVLKVLGVSEKAFDAPSMRWPKPAILPFSTVDRAASLAQYNPHFPVPTISTVDDLSDRAARLAISQVTVPEMVSSLPMTPGPLEVLPMTVFSGPDAEGQLHLSPQTPVVDVGASAGGSTGGSSTRTLLMNLTPSPYPSFPAGQEQPKAPAGFLGHARERRGGLGSAGDEFVSTRPMPSETEEPSLQQQKGSSMRDVDVGRVLKDEETASGTQESESKAQGSMASIPSVSDSGLTTGGRLGSMTIEGRRMPLRKRRRQEARDSAGGNEGGVIALGSVLTRSPEVSNLAIGDENEVSSPELGRRQRRKHSHSMIAPQSLPLSNAATSVDLGPLVASIPSRTSVDIVDVPEATSRMPPAVAMIGGSTPVLMKKRGKLPKDVTETLKSWLMAHKSHPYPSEEEKKMLCEKTQLNMSQVSNWMINARRRILVPPNKKKQVFQQAVAPKPRPVYTAPCSTPPISVPSTSPSIPTPSMPFSMPASSTCPSTQPI